MVVVDDLEGSDYSRQVLEEAPARVTRFLQAIAAVPMIRTYMAQAGMTTADIVEGRTLLLRALGEPQISAWDQDTDDARSQRAAVAELDDWDEPNFQRFEATLRRHAPSARDFVFSGLKASRGPDAVNGVATFLKRIDILEAGSDPERSASKKDDQKAVALLAKRGLTEAERKRIRKLVDRALGPTAPLDTPPDESARLMQLNELRSWYDEWSAAARAVIKKRGYLIRLGMAERRSPTNKTGTETLTDAPTPDASDS